MADPVNIPTPVANGSLEDAQNFVNTLPGNMSPEQRAAIAQGNQGWQPDFVPYRAPAGGAAQPDFVPYQGQQEEPPKAFDDPRVGKLGYYVNGDGNTVIAPKDGEEYADTIKRAVEHSQGMTPEQRQAAMDRETSDTGKKVIGTLGTAAGLGVGGAAGLAAPGEIAAAGHALIPLTTGGVKAVGGWAAKNPVQAYLLFQVLKELVPGMKQAVGIVKGTPDAP